MAITKLKKILIAPLDWGLGHTTRCIPIIRYLQSRQHHITFAGNAFQRRFIEQTFPNIETIHIEGYNITYSRTAIGFLPALLRQGPKILKTIAREHRWLAQMQEEHQFDLIISDNRYGLYHAATPSYVLTHQLEIQTGLGGFINSLVRKAHYRMLQKFTGCWVVDNEGADNLSGALAHPRALPANATYIGLLSQFDDVEAQKGEAQYILILLSGPEPQRTILSKLLWEQALASKSKVVFVEGKENAQPHSIVPPHIAYHKRVGSQMLRDLIEHAAMVICRSGYSTIMDLVYLHKKAIIIPTPGQTEQEYLGRHLSNRQYFFCIPQKDAGLQPVSSPAVVGYEPPYLQEHFHTYRRVLDQHV